MKTISFLLLLIHLQLTSCETSSSPKTIASASASEKTSMLPSLALEKIPVPPPKSQPQLLKETPHFIFTGMGGDFEEGSLDDLVARMENTFQQIEDFTGKSGKSFSKIKVFLYPSAEKKGLAIKNTNQSSIDFQKNEVHIVFNEIYENNFLQLENQLFIRHLLEKTPMKAIETGLGIYFTKKWQQQGYEYWASKLHLSGNMPALTQLLQNDTFEQSSSLMMGAMSGAFAAFLIEEWSKEMFLKEYKRLVISPKEVEKLQSKWLQFLGKMSESYKPSMGTHSLRKKKNASSLPYFKGFNFAHEGYNIYDGYISQEAAKALTALQQIGTNAVAIVPYSGMKSPHSLQPNDMRLWRRAGMENDESVIHAAFQAKKRGMSIILKPQIWVHDSWPGDVDFNIKQDWQVFFERYRQWIMHYALLAEMYDFDAFCVGVEFMNATLKHPEEWRKIIRQVKKLYGGQVTYAANWGEEFEKNTLWNEVDFIGINCYYPLSHKENPSDIELQKGFETTLDKIEAVAQKFDKKIVFTEIGFRSIPRPWISPHHYDWNERPPFKEEDQKRCYEVVMKALQNKDWCRGILWWKWPSYLAHSQHDKTEFAPNGKMAEGVILKWFGK